MQVSSFVRGAMDFGKLRGTTIVDAAIEAGINLIDTADR